MESGPGAGSQKTGGKSGTHDTPDPNPVSGCHKAAFGCLCPLGYASSPEAVQNRVDILGLLQSYLRERKKFFLALW